MGRRKSKAEFQHENKDVTFCGCNIDIIKLSHNESNYTNSIGALFASVGQAGIGFGISPKITTIPNIALEPQPKQITPRPQLTRDQKASKNKRSYDKRVGLKLRIKIENESARRLLSGGIAGAVSRTVVAPLETIKTHLMAGSCGRSLSAIEVFESIVASDGWRGLYRGNLVNVIRVAPNKAIELFAYDSMKKWLSPKAGEKRENMRVPESLVAGAVAGMSSTLFTYPLELIKTRLTVQRGVYKNLFHALVKIASDEGPAELYRGLVPSIIGVVPYAAANYFAYDALRGAHRRAFGGEDKDIGNIATLLMGSAAAVASSAATFPLEVARKQMQASAVNGTRYANMVHALLCIAEKEGVSGLYRGLGPSCMKLVPAAGISFMCYEACKRFMLENNEED